MELQLRGQTALITGGASGIGLGIARVLAREGMDLAVASRNPDPAAVADLRGTGVRVESLAFDVAREDQATAMVDEAVRLFGRLDAYVNNAAWAWHEPVTRLTSQAWNDTLSTNLTGAMWACRAAARHMVANRRGTMVLISSTAKLVTGYGETAYRVSKLGLNALMQSLCVELAPYGIRVNMVTPGHFVTRLTGWDRLNRELVEKFRDQYIPLQRFGDVEQVGAAVALLLSDAVSGYTTGADMVIDGGLQHAPVKVLDDDAIRAMNAVVPASTAAQPGRGRATGDA